MGQCCSCLHPGGDLPSLPEPERITLHEARPSWRRSPPAGHEEASSSAASDATRNSRLQEPNQHNREPRPDPELSEILHRIVSSDDNHAQPTFEESGMQQADAKYLSIRHDQLTPSHRQYLESLRPEALAWKRLWSQTRSRPYFFSAVTLEVRWGQPEGFVQRHRLESQLVGDAGHLASATAVCARLGISLEVLQPLLSGDSPNIEDSVYGSRIKGDPPSLADCLFYQPLLCHVLNLYPESLIRACGLSRIVLTSRLSYMGQSRRLIPVLAATPPDAPPSSTLYIDPSPLPVYYLMDCFHHELYHFLDMSIIRRVRFPQHPANSSLPPARRNQVKDVRPVDIGGELLEEEHKLLEVSVVEAPSALLAQEESPKESRSMFDFLDQAEVGLQGLPSVLEDDDMHAVARGTGWSRYSRDRGWECFNADPGFCYGSGGDHAENRREVRLASSVEALIPESILPYTSDSWRVNNMYISSGEGAIPGFLNLYSTTSPEEDKAEIFAALIRNPQAMLGSADPGLQAKARQICTWLQALCPEMDRGFWVQMSKDDRFPYSERPQRVSLGWQVRKDPKGLPYWWNSMTHQTSWLDPNLMFK